MFDSMGSAKFLTGALYVNAALAVFLATNFSGMPHASQVSVSVMVVSIMLFLAGQTRLFPWLCSLPGIWRIFPNVEGKYEVEISSNWSVIQARDEGREPDASPEGDIALFKRVGTATITARLSRIGMSLKMDDGYLTSETVTCSLRRDLGQRKPVLFYIYDSAVSVPKQTDTSRHLGGACIPIPLERRPKELLGNYWTDRNWHRGLNTAGQIRLRRIS